MRVLLLALLLSVLAVSCGDDNADDDGGAAGISQEIVDVIDDHIRNTGGLGGPVEVLTLVADCAEIGAQPALCIDAEASTVLETEATVRVYANQSDASWDVSLLKRDGRWTVTNVAYTGVR